MPDQRFSDKLDDVSQHSSRNDEIRVARAFHDRTTHTPASVRTSGHTLDWDVKPLPFKIYATLEPLSLPREIQPIAVDTLVALTSPSPPRAGSLTLSDVAAVLYYAAGVTKKKTYPGGGEVLFRAAASTGALFQTEVYLAAGEVDGLASGLYHFCPGDFALRRLRDGDVRAALADAAADDSISRRAATIVLSAMYWRNTWKYESRGYRHLFWDSGTMLANLLACGDAMGLAPRVLTGFVDTAVNRLLGLDARHEAALELVPLGPETAVAPVARALPPIQLDVVPLSSSEVDYPALRDMHEASMLDSAAAVDHWRTGRLDDASPRSRSSGRTVAAHDREGNRSSAVEAHLVPLPAATREAGRGLGDTIQRRGSTREFGEAPLSLLELATTLWCATRPWDSDAPSGLVDVFLVANAVDGLTPGAYRYRPDAHALEIVREG